MFKAIVTETLDGISFISLVTNDKQKFEDSDKFYNNLGFRLTKSFSRVTNSSSAAVASNPKLQLGVAKESSREIWLESFPLQDVDENDAS